MLKLDLDLEVLRRSNSIKEIEREYLDFFKGVAVPFDSICQNNGHTIKKGSGEVCSDTLKPEIRKILKQELKDFKQI